MPTFVLSADEILADLKAKGNEKTRALYGRHGMPVEKVYGTSVADMKTIAKTIKGRQDLALELYASGFMEAMYLAGMVANGTKMSRAELDSWADGAASMPMIAEYTVPWVTVENAAGAELAVKWIGSAEQKTAVSGWCTYSGLVATKADEALDVKEIERLLETVVAGIPRAKNRVRLTMNSFVISVGKYVTPLLGKAKATARELGVVEVDMGETACEVPSALAAIEKAEAAGKLGQKKKTIRC